MEDQLTIVTREAVFVHGRGGPGILGGERNVRRVRESDWRDDQIRKNRTRDVRRGNQRNSLRCIFMSY